MSISVHRSTIRTIKSDDPMFRIGDGLITAQRAGFEVNQHCPYEYRLIISECIDRGWLKPVAYMHDYEQTFAILKNE